MMRIQLKRLFNNIASVRDYIVEDAIKRQVPIELTVLGREGKMTLAPEDLESKKFQIGKTKFKSKYNPHQEYELIDFSWKPE